MSRSESSREVSMTTSSEPRSSGASPVRSTSAPPCGAIRRSVVTARHAVTWAGTSPSSSSFAMTCAADSSGESPSVSTTISALLRRLVRVVDAGEALDLAGERLRVEAVHVAAGALVERGPDVDLDEGAVLLDQRACVSACLGVRRDRRDDDGTAVARDPRGDPAEPLDVRVAVLLREAEALREVRADRVAVQVLDDEAAPVHLGADVVRDRGLPRPGEPREPEREAAASVGLGLGVLVRVDVLTHAVPFEVRVLVNAALELVRARPATGALLLVRGRRPGARNAPDRAVPRVVQRVGGYLVDVDVRPHPLLVPVCERVDLEDLVPLRPLHLRRVDDGSATGRGGCRRSRRRTAGAPGRAAPPCGCGSSGRDRAPTGSAPRRDAARRPSGSRAG